MKTRRTLYLFLSLLILCSTGSSCSFVNKVFGPKYGCPANGRNVGAERILSGEKVPRAPKFKA